MSFCQSITKYHYRWLTIAMLAVVCVAVVSVLVWNSHRPSRRYAQIEQGMHFDDVVALFRAEPGEYRSAPSYMIVQQLRPPDLEDPQEKEFKLHVWYFDEGIVQVRCDSEQRVVD